MANIHDCLQRAVQSGDLDADKAEAAGEEFDQLLDRYRQILPEVQAEEAALKDLKETTSRARRSRRHMVLNQLQMARRIKAQIEDAPDAARALLDMFETLPGSTYSGENVRFLQEALTARIRADLRDVLRHMGLNVLGSNRDKAGLRDLLRELHGQPSGNPIAVGFADQVRRTQTWLREMFNDLGGDIGQIADYGVRHTHDADAIQAAGFNSWADTVFDQLDWSRIVDLNTGKPFVTDAALRPNRPQALAFLQRIFDTITTEGALDREPTMVLGSKALYRKYDDARVLHFQNGDAWLAYNEQFGRTDPWAAMIGGMDAMAREVALMRVFGPNPNAGLAFAVNTADIIAKKSRDPGLKKRVAQATKRAQVQMFHANGAVNQPEHEGWARFFSNVRHFNVATKLGATIASAVTDTATIITGATAMGQNPANVLARAMSLTFSSASRETAARAGFVAETLMSIATSSARLTNDVVAGDIMSRLSGFVIRAQGLAHWTDSMRTAVQMETAGHMAGEADRALADLDPMLRNLLERNGITAEDWDALRLDQGGRFIAPNGSDFIAPFWWLAHQSTLPRTRAEGVALRLQAALMDQAELFVPTKRTRATRSVLGASRPGTAGGELLRSTLGFKNYALSLTMGQIHLYRSLPTPQTKGVYLATLAASMLTMGAVAVQLKELVKGRDPRPMDEPKFWFAALMQSGGLGIFGDFAFSERNRFGGGIEQTLAGPVAGLAGDVMRIPMSNVNAMIEGEETNLGADVANFVRFNTPVASSFWPTRVAFDAVVADQLQLLLDGDAEATWKRQERKQRQDYGNGNWWGHGEMAPQRGPDWSNALGEGR
ncbi:hypothetical protein CDO87_03390 [Sagittula sp. P11]|uniref:hypothetical protein n=1 Tax=Sagittula sp. P11 TaxID=2009329 RepID=UPI000C2D14B0|nr:hypothetical protein [Sagittula sp. P11]AUC52289.1 hypothetical protein CDO87_03390 [Sagittula sp. P11]